MSRPFGCPALRARVGAGACTALVVLGAGACRDATAPDLVGASSGHWQGTFTLEPHEPRWERLFDLTLHPAPGGGVEGSAWGADLLPTIGGQDFTLENAYTVRGTVEGDRLVLTLSSVQPDPENPERWTQVVTLQEDGGRLHATLAPTWPWETWKRAAGPLARSEVPYGTGTLSVRYDADAAQRTFAASVAPSPYGERGWTIGGDGYVGLQFPGGRPAVGTYRVVPGGGANGDAGARDVWVTLDQRCYKAGCVAYRPAAGDTGEVAVTVATPTRVAGTYRLSATHSASVPGLGRAGAAERVVASGAFDVPCIAAACR